MKLNILSKLPTTILVCLFLFSPSLSAQDKDPKIKNTNGKDLRALFMEMHKTAKLTNPKTKKPCYADALSILNTIDKKKLLPTSKDINNLFSQLESRFKKINKDLDKVPIDRKFFPTKVDRLLDDFEKIVEISDLDPVINDEGFNNEFLDDLLKKSGKDFDKHKASAQDGLEWLIASLFKSYYIGNEHSFKQKQCKIKVNSKITPAKLSYPKMRWQIMSWIDIECDCKKNNAKKVNYVSLFYTTDIDGFFTASEQNFKKSRIANPKLKVTNLRCCPEKKEEEKASHMQQDISIMPDETDTDGDGVYDIDDACPKVPGYPEFNGCNDSDGDGIQDSKDYCPEVVGSLEFGGCPDTDGDGIADNYDDCPNVAGIRELNGCAGDDENKKGKFHIGAHIGTPVGDEADFFGIAYGVETGYFYKLNKKFEIGATTGYTYYTGRETDFGFETEGEGFIPITAKGAYNFSESFGVEAGLGYAISTGGGEGGLTYSLGPFWRPLEVVLIVINYVNISFGEGSLGALMLSGRISLQKKKKK